MNSPDILSVREDPQAMVEQFQHRLWMHPFVAEDTLAFRNDAMKTVEDAFELHHVDTQHCFAMFTGSFVSIPLKNSDKDILIVHAEPEDPIASHQLSKQLYELEEHAMGHISVLDTRPASSLLPPNKVPAMAVLLLTADQFIVGNRDLASATRREVAERIKDRPRAKTWDYVEEIYNRFYRGWKDLPGEQGKRSARFNETIGLYDMSHRRMGVWLEAAVKRTEALSLPPKDIYLGGILANNGALLLPNPSR